MSAPAKTGHIIRVSEFVWEFIQSQRRTRTTRRGRKSRESVDSCMRRLFGFPSRRGILPESGIVWILPKSGLALRSAEEARGMAILKSVEQSRLEGRKVRPEEPKLYREVI